MKLTKSAEYHASPEEVFAVLSDPGFASAKCAATAAIKHRQRWPAGRAHRHHHRAGPAQPWAPRLREVLRGARPSPSTRCRTRAPPRATAPAGRRHGGGRRAAHDARHTASRAGWPRHLEHIEADLKGQGPAHRWQAREGCGVADPGGHPASRCRPPTVASANPQRACGKGLEPQWFQALSRSQAAPISPYAGRRGSSVG